MKQRGTAIVEFTIALPLLLFLMLATVEFGRVLSNYNTLTQAARDAARYVAANASAGTTRVVSLTQALQNQSANLVVTGNVNGTGSALLTGLVASNVTTADAGNGYISVSVNYTYSPIVGSSLPSFGFGSPISLTFPLKAGVVMRVL